MKLRANVYVTDPETGLPVFLTPADEVPEWAESQITNPKVIDSGDPEAPVEPEEGSGGGPPAPEELDMGEGPLAKRRVHQLRNLAAAQEPSVDLEGVSNKDDILDRLEAAGVTG